MYLCHCDKGGLSIIILALTVGEILLYISYVRCYLPRTGCVSVCFPRQLPSHATGLFESVYVCLRKCVKVCEKYVSVLGGRRKGRS